MLLGRGVVFSAGGRGTALLLARGGVFSAGGRGTALLLARSGGWAALLLGCAALLALFGRSVFAALGAGPRVAGVFTGAFLAAATPAPRNSPGLAVAATGGTPWFVEANSE